MTNTYKSLIRQIFLDVTNHNIEYLDSLQEEKTPHSEAYSGFIADLTKKHSAEKRTKHISKRAVSAIIAAILFAAFSISALAFRQPILDFIEENFGIYTRFTSKSNEDIASTTVYVPKYIPDGYVKRKEFIYSTGASINYVNGENTILYNQTPKNSGSITLNTENNPYEVIYVGEQAMYRTIRHNACTVLWEKDDSQFVISLPYDLGWEEIEKILLSITPIEE